MADHDPDDGLADPATALGVDQTRLESASARVEIAGEDLPVLTLAVELVNGRTVRMELPEQFVAGGGRRLDRAALLQWLGIEAQDVSDNLAVQMAHGPVAMPESSNEEPGPDQWHFVRPGEFLDPAISSLDLGRLPGPEAAEAMMAGTPAPPPPAPELGDTDAWPDTVEDWLADLDSRLRHDPGLTAADYRALYGGLDDGTFDPDDSSWDPKTGSLDPTMEEALRIRDVPGALPPPEALPDRPDVDDDVAPDEDLPVIAVDNRMAIEAEPSPDRSGCLTSIVMRWIAGGLAAAVAIVFLILILMTRSDSGTDSSGPTVNADAAAEESAADVLRRATQDLLDARAAEIEQTLTIATDVAGDTTVAAEGVVDLEVGEAQSTVEAEGTSLQTFVSDTVYAFDAGNGWVEAAPGELNENEDVLRLGLGAFGIGEALNPLAIAHLAGAAEEVEEVGDGVFEALAVLPVEGAGAMHVDNWSRAVVGRPQEELSGFGIRLTVTPSIDGEMTITAIVELDDAIPFLGDDPQAESLRGITLTNRSAFTQVGMPVDLSAREADRQELQAFLGQFP